MLVIKICLKEYHSRHLSQNQASDLFFSSLMNFPIYQNPVCLIRPFKSVSFPSPCLRFASHSPS